MLIGAQALLHTWNATQIMISSFVHIKRAHAPAAETAATPETTATQEIRCKGHDLEVGAKRLRCMRTYVQNAIPNW